MKKHSNKKSKKNTYKLNKRIAKVIRAILRMDESTAMIAESMEPMLTAFALSQHEWLTQQIHWQQHPNKDKKQQFRETWLDKQEVIQLLTISERSLHTLREEGKLKSYGFKGRVYFKLKDIESLMEEKPLVKRKKAS